MPQTLERRERQTRRIKKRRGKRIKAPDDKIFNAGIWSGRQAKNLGLVDDIGDYYSVMKKKLGKDVKFKDFSKKQSWIKQKFFSNSKGADMFNSFLYSIEEKLIWSKYDL